MPDLPFSPHGLNCAVNLAALWLVLESFDFRPFSPRPPWRSRRTDVVLWLLLAANALLFIGNFGALMVTYLYRIKGA